MSNVRVAGALQMLVQELGGSKATAGAAGALGSVLGAILQGNNNDNNNDTGVGNNGFGRPSSSAVPPLPKPPLPSKAPHSYTRSLFHGETKSQASESQAQQQTPIR
jgi:hypothetical protein